MAFSKAAPVLYAQSMLTAQDAQPRGRGEGGSMNQARNVRQRLAAVVAMTLIGGGCGGLTFGGVAWGQEATADLARPGADAGPGVVATSKVQTGVFVRDAPSLSGVVIEALLPGEQLNLRAAGSDWNEILLPDGRAGFVSRDWTRILAPPLGLGQFRMHVVDVGTGLGLFVEGADFTLVYDAGSNDDRSKGPNNRFLAYLRYVRPDLKRIDHVVLSHPHQDHVILLPDLFSAFQIGQVWDSGTTLDTCSYQEFLAAVSTEPGVNYHQVKGGPGPVTKHATGCAKAQNLTLNGGAAIPASAIALGAQAQMTILYRNAEPHADPNENSLVTRLDLGGARLLLMGDAEAGERAKPTDPPEPGSIEAKLLECCAAALKADILVAGHHGSLTSSRTAFLNAVRAKTYIISSGPFPYGKERIVLPDKAVEEEFHSRGKLLQTNLKDEACRTNPGKIGNDNDKRPGGCDNIVVTIDRSVISADYLRVAD